MKLIIDIPEEIYIEKKEDYIGDTLDRAIANGTPFDDELDKIIRDIDDLKCFTMEADFRDRVFKVIEEHKE